MINIYAQGGAVHTFYYRYTRHRITPPTTEFDEFDPAHTLAHLDLNV